MFDFLRGNRWFGTAPSEDELLAKWNSEHIRRNAGTVREALFGYQHIIEVKWGKVFKQSHHGVQPPWSVQDEFAEQYTYPYRDLGDHCVVLEMRGVHDKNNIFERNEFGADGVFVGTNNSADAVMIALKYK